MSNAYSHISLAEKCRRDSKGMLRKIIDADKELFLLGSLGPDIYFYYRSLIDSTMHRYGSQAHRISFSDYLFGFRNNLGKSGNKNGETAYLLGFLSHFLLDNNVHGYVEAKLLASGVSHSRIETEFDSYLLRKDGIDPTRHNSWKEISASENNAAVIQSLFGDYSVEEYRKFLQAGKRYNSLMRTGIPVWGKIMVSLMKMLKVKESYFDLLPQKQEDPRCADSNLRLEKYLELSRKQFGEYADSMLSFLYSNGSMPKRFMQDFGPQVGWEKIPVLDYQQEKEFKVL